MCWRTLAGSGPLNVSVWWPLVEQWGRQNQTLHSLEVKPSAAHYQKKPHDRQWWYVSMRMNLDTTSCSQGGCRNRMLSGRSPVASAGICCPHHHSPQSYMHPHPHSPHPLCPPPSRSLAWQTGSLLYSAGKWQPCGGPEGLVGVFPQGSSSFHPTPKGANPGSQHK